MSEDDREPEVAPPKPARPERLATLVQPPISASQFTPAELAPIISSVGPPASFEEYIFRLWAAIETVYQTAAWRHEVDPRSEDWLTKNEERLYEKLAAWLKDPIATAQLMVEMRHHRGRLNEDEYISWLHIHNEQTLYRRGILFREHETVDWGSHLVELPFYRYFPPDVADKLVDKSHGKPNFYELGGFMVKHNKAQGTTTVVIDASRRATMGLTGIGKTTLAFELAAILDGTDRGFHILRDVVYKKDEEAVKRLLFNDERRFRAMVMDEAEWFIDRRRATSRIVLEQGREFMSKRYKNQYDVLVLPSIWTLDERFHAGLIQWRFRVRQRGLVDVFLNNGEYDHDQDRFGRPITTFRYPDWPPLIRGFYERAKVAVDKYGTMLKARKESAEFARLLAQVDDLLSKRKADELINPGGRFGVSAGAVRPGQEYESNQENE